MVLDQLNYTSLADRKVIDIFLMAGQPLREAEKLFSHILNAQHIWTSRIYGEEPGFDRFELHPVQEFEKIHLTNMKRLLEIFHTKDPHQQVIYKNSQGEEFLDIISDILFHVVNHSTYHRGQIMAQFRLHGITPPPTDYIMFKRQGEL